MVALGTYVKRLHLWSRVASELRFVGSPSGRNGLLRSLLWAPFSALKDTQKFCNLLLLEDVTVEARDVGRFQLRSLSDDLYVALPSSEPTILRYIRMTLCDGDVFVDAGANIGFYTVAGSRLVGNKGAVVAIEMIPETFERLSAHVRLNACSNVRLVNAAISDRSGETVTAFLPGRGRHGKASIVSLDAESEGQMISVKTQTLDDILAGYSKVRLMKMDLEGAEMLAIGGATNILDRIDAIVFEKWDSEHDISRTLEAAGFRVRPLDPQNSIAERRAETPRI